jgi:hypothetical protein
LIVLAVKVHFLSLGAEFLPAPSTHVLDPRMRTRGSMGPEPLVTLLADGAAVPDHKIRSFAAAARYGALLIRERGLPGEQSTNLLRG